jgi:general stress protein CsbA
MKSNLLGVALVLAGAIFLVASYVAGWTTSNWVLLFGLALIVLGIMIHAKLAKSGDNY